MARKTKCGKCGGEKLEPRSLMCRPCWTKVRVVPVKDRFLKYVKKTDSCWIWTGSVWKGYGRFMSDRCKKAHRVSYEIFNGPIEKGKDILHSCNNSLCVNPQHLRQGTQSENERDAVKNGTHPNQKLTIAEANEIRSLRAKGFSYKDLMGQYRVSNDTICRVLSGDSYRESY